VWALQHVSPARQSGRDWRYVAVLDCGSSGTRASIFQVENVPGSILPRLRLLPPTEAPGKVPHRQGGMIVDRIETTPGIAESYQRDTWYGVHTSLSPLLVWAAAAVPAEAQAHTALLLCGTAGLRGLSQAERSVRSPSCLASSPP
jgi:Golgi nucleoside diphosphatase